MRMAGELVSRRGCALWMGILSLVTFADWAAAAPPNAPTIFEPTSEGAIVNAADVHMVSSFSDPDPGNTHQASDYEIWNNSLTERVWRVLNVTGPEKIHVHFGDGVFENSLTGATQLLFSTPYKLRVRHQDNTGVWSPYAIRGFVTAAATQVFSLETEDIAMVPAPLWRDDASADMILPSSSTQPYLRLESADGTGLLLEFRGLNGTQNQITNPAALADHVDVRVLVHAGNVSGGLSKPQSTIAFTDAHGGAHTIYLPAISLSSGQSTVYWVSVNGSTYQGNTGQTSRFHPPHSRIPSMSTLLMIMV
ncbi:MAG: hypothetical protein AMXMBFR13_16600 [Phycisphaerae bacterium]